MINYKRHRKAIEKLYEDKATISRHSKIKVNGETKLVLLPVCIDEPCRLSQKSLGGNGQTEAQNDIIYETKLFISPDVEIEQGDEFTVTRGKITADGWEAVGPERKYTAGEPFPYGSHQEITLSRKDKA